MGESNYQSSTKLPEISQAGNATYATNDKDNLQKIKALAAQDKKTIEEQ